MIAPEPTWEPTTRDLDASEDDLDWWHGVRASALGAHGCDYNGSGESKWDDAAIWRLFEAVWRPERRKAARRYFQVAPLVGALGHGRRELARAIYEPRNYPPCIASAFPADRRAQGLATLAGAALMGVAIPSAYARAHGGKPAPSRWHVTRWLEDEAATLAKRPAWLDHARVEASAMRLELLTTYARLRRERVERERRGERRCVAECRGSLS